VPVQHQGLEASGATGRGSRPELDQGGLLRGQVTGQVLHTHDRGSHGGALDPQPPASGGFPQFKSGKGSPAKRWVNKNQNPPNERDLNSNTILLMVKVTAQSRANKRVSGSPGPDHGTHKQTQEQRKVERRDAPRETRDKDYNEGQTKTQRGTMRLIKRQTAK